MIYSSSEFITKNYVTFLQHRVPGYLMIDVNPDSSQTFLNIYYDTQT